MNLIPAMPNLRAQPLQYNQQKYDVQANQKMFQDSSMRNRIAFEDQNCIAPPCSAYRRSHKRAQ